MLQLEWSLEDGDHLSPQEGGGGDPSFYTTKEEAVYTIVVKEYVNGEWVVFDDMQIVCQD